MSRSLSSRLSNAISAASFAALLTLAVVASSWAESGGMHTSRRFQGPKANTGAVSHVLQDGKHTLTLSGDFKVPEAPAPHWQIVDSSGNVYLLQRLMVKVGMAQHETLNRTITVPSYVADIAKVQIWCAWAETVLGETTFDTTIRLSDGMAGEMARMRTSSMFHGVKANTGTVSHAHKGGKRVLTLSDDFKAPDAPAPHWQVVDSRGNVYLLQSLNIKGDAGGTMNRSIVVPGYVADIIKVQMWCAYAEVLLGEAGFDSPVM